VSFIFKLVVCCNSSLLIPRPSLIEQPFKIPFVAAVILYTNDTNAEVAKEVLARAAAHAQISMENGDWREFKLLLRFFACMQGLYEGDGVFPLLDELFNRAADQQTASQEDVSRQIGTRPSNF
jgi:nuclear cap-binding protein subunit 1